MNNGILIVEELLKEHGIEYRRVGDMLHAINDDAMLFPIFDVSDGYALGLQDYL